MRRQPAQGFTYLGLIILVAVLGLVGAAGMKMGTLFQRAAAEEELLEIGNQFSAALRSYAAATPQGQPQQPPTLQDLLKDPRFPNPRRHLRKIFVDPVTGKAEWGIVYVGDKVGVLGVYSLSNARPLKIANFDIRFQNMDNREHISDWKFLMAGGDGVAAAVVTAPNTMTGAPSLFGPGGTGAGKGGDAKPGAGKPGEAPPAPVSKPAEPAPEAAPPPEEPAVEGAKQEEGQPAEAPAEEEKEADDKDKEKTDDGKQGTSETGKPVIAPPEVTRHKR